MISEKVDVEFKDNDGRICLLWIIGSGYLDVIWLLIEYGVNIELKDILDCSWGVV